MTQHESAVQIKSSRGKYEATECGVMLGEWAETQADIDCLLRDVAEVIGVPPAYLAYCVAADDSCEVAIGQVWGRTECILCAYESCIALNVSHAAARLPDSTAEPSGTAVVNAKGTAHEIQDRAHAPEAVRHFKCPGR